MKIETEIYDLYLDIVNHVHGGNTSAATREIGIHRTHAYWIKKHPNGGADYTKKLMEKVNVCHNRHLRAINKAKREEG